MTTHEPAAVPARVALTACAVYAKASAHEDYSWIFDERQVPVEVMQIGETLSNLTGSAAVIDSGAGTWVLRSFVHGIDSASRPSAAVEISRLDQPSTGDPLLWLLVAGNSIHWPPRYYREPFEATLTDPDTHPVPPAPEEQWRARLGLPLATDVGGALTIVQRRPFRYSGVCYTARAGGGVVPFRSELRPLLCINFAKPIADRETTEDLRFLQSSSFEVEQLRLLDAMSNDEAQSAIRWSRAAADDPGTMRAAAGVPSRWVIGELARKTVPPALFAACVAALDPVTLIESAAAAAPDVSPEAARFLACAGSGEAQHATETIATELARHGYLTAIDAAPIAAWAEHALRSTAVAEAAIAVLQRTGVSPATASFVLGLDDASQGVPGDVARAVEIASHHGLVLPVARLGRMLLRSGATNELLEQIAAAAGEPFVSAAAVANSGRIPSHPIPPELLASALAIRKRVEGHEEVFLDAISELVEQHREQEVLDLLDVATDDMVSRGIRELLEAFLMRRGPVADAWPPGLRVLASRGLLLPEHVEPRTSGELTIAARAWPQTAWLANLLELRGASDTPPSGLPSGWISAARAAFGPAAAAAVLRRATPAARRSLHVWLVELNDLDVSFWSALGTDDTAPQPRDSNETIAMWIEPMTAGDGRGQRFRVLAQLASRSSSWSDDSATHTVARVLAGDHEFTCELAEHLLSRRGPLPPFRDIPADMLGIAMELLPPVEVIRHVFATEATKADDDEECINLIATRLVASGAMCPPHGFSRRQIERHPLLAERLSAIPGWEELASREQRIHAAFRYISRLGVRVEELSSQAIKAGDDDVRS